MADKFQDVLMRLGDEAPEARQVTLSNGIVLKGRRFARQAMKKLLENYPMPKVPVQTITEDDGSTWEQENPMHPEYLEAVEACHSDRLNASLKLVATLGTDFVSAPEGVETPESEGWVDELEAVGLELPEMKTPRQRYSVWLDLYAITSPEDGASVYGLGLWGHGLFEAEVLEAMAFFRRSTRWGTNLAEAIVETGRDGD